MTTFGEQIKDAQRVRQGETVVPAFQKTAFHCLFCGVFTGQKWTVLKIYSPSETTSYSNTRIWECTCDNCAFDSSWLQDVGKDASHRLLYPWGGGQAPLPHASMPPDVRADYEEARSIVDKSPRGASALLRLALQKLMPHLGEREKTSTATSPPL